jgi:hypothetical protein
MQSFMTSARLPPSSIILRRSPAVAVGVGPRTTCFCFGIGEDSVVIGDADVLMKLPPTLVLVLVLLSFSSSFLEIVTSSFGKLVVVEDGELEVCLADVVTAVSTVVVGEGDAFAVAPPLGGADEVVVGADAEVGAVGVVLVPV